VLNAEQIAQFHRDGFLKIPGLFRGRELDDLRRAADAVVSEAVAGRGKDHAYHQRPDGQKVYFRSERMWQRDPIFQAATVKPELLEAIGQCYGQPFLPFNDSFVCKVPFGDVPIAWHQDPPYNDKSRTATCDIPNFDTDIYLDRSTVANGCVWGIPGRHLVGHVDLYSQPQRDLFEKYGAVPMDMEPGDVLFHSISGPHGSAGNKTADMRRIFYVHYLPAEVFRREYGTVYAWAKGKDPDTPEKKAAFQEMVKVRKRLGYGGLENSRVRWTEDGFDFVGEPRTPMRYWGTLAARMSEAEKKRLRTLEPVAAQAPAATSIS
jgi:phytanoyl-CoA hydroxylase